MKKLKRGQTYGFDTWGEAAYFCKKYELPLDCIESVYLTYRITI